MRLVLVDWEDASEEDDGPWVERDCAQPTEARIFRQVGFLVSETKDEVVLTRAYDADHMAVRDRIPRGMVRTMLELDPASGVPYKRRPSKPCRRQSKR